MASDPRNTNGVLLTVAYDGRPFGGYARQTNARTVAGELDGAIRAVDPRASLVRGASRTDAGVHARGQRIAFDTSREIAPRGWVLALMPHLPREIAVVACARVEAGYDPRRHALMKTYRYVVLSSVVRDPFLDRRAWRVEQRLNQQRMQDEATTLLGEHDFAAFRSSADVRTTTVRRIVRAEVRRAGGDARCLEIVIRGNRFLHRMVRIIAGTLVDVGRGRLEPGAITRAVASGSRRDLGMTAPPDGLYLDEIELESEGQDTWPEQPSRID